MYMTSLHACLTDAFLPADEAGDHSAGSEPDAAAAARKELGQKQRFGKATGAVASQLGDDIMVLLQ